MSVKDFRKNVSLENLVPLSAPQAPTPSQDAHTSTGQDIRTEEKHKTMTSKTMLAKKPHANKFKSSLHIDHELHQHLKFLSLSLNQPLGLLIETAIQEFVDRHASLFDQNLKKLAKRKSL